MTLTELPKKEQKREGEADEKRSTGYDSDYDDDRSGSSAGQLRTLEVRTSESHTQQCTNPRRALSLSALLSSVHCSAPCTACRR